MWRLAAGVALALAWLAPGASASYDCSGTESVGEVQGEVGSICSPRCQGDALTCPAVPAGVTAQPQCMLQDVNQVSYCGLLCTSDSSCPSGAFCKTIDNVGVCIHPLSYSEWAGSQTQRTKLAVAFSNKPQNANAGSFKIAKAYAALQSLKRRFNMADGDADVLVVKELIAAASAIAVKSKPAASATGVVNLEIATPAGFAPAPSPGASSAPAPLPPVADPKPNDMSSAAFGHDVNYFMHNLEMGQAGLLKEIKDTEWNLEHLGRRGVCTELLRSGILIALVYLVGGAIYKNQAMGATGIDMVPHVGFWMEYPSLVSDGIQYVMMTGTELLGGRPVSRTSGGIGGQPGDRDTFANFEPSK